MRRPISMILTSALMLSVAAVAWAQPASPHETTTATIDGKKVTVEYGRPYMKGREIFGGLVPWNEVWRTGADQATTLTVEGDCKVGTISVPAGTYSLFTLPTEKGWTLILNKTAKQWGAFKYEESTDLGRTPMTMSMVDSPVEQFTIAIEPKTGGGGVLKLSWDKTVASVDISSQ